MSIIPNLKQGFRHKHTELGTLVIPKYSKWSWKPEERAFRSAIVDNNEIVSSGFVKFGGIEEEGFISDVEKLKKELQEKKQLRVVEKMDGVLAIRSVIQGKVVWRTRGTVDGGVYAPFFKQLSVSILEDPTFMTEQSLLFEFLHPDWQIVIKHYHPQLVFLGVVEHQDSRLWNWDECKDLADKHNFIMPKTSIWTGSWKNLIKHTNQNKGSEGIVVQSEDGQTLVKIKTEAYRSLHRIRFVHQGQLLVELWERNNWTNFDDAKQWLFDHGVDIKDVPQLETRVQQLCDTFSQAEKELLTLDQELLSLQMKKGDVKNFKQSLDIEKRNVLDLLVDGRENFAQEKLQRILIADLLAEWEKEEDIQE